MSKRIKKRRREATKRRGSMGHDPNNQFQFLNVAQAIVTVKRIANRHGYHGDPYETPTRAQGTLEEQLAISAIVVDVPKQLKRHMRPMVENIARKIVLNHHED